ncbi:polysaccharide lyase family 7 protein [Flavobacteriaceae bacterium LMO-SS05]
MKYIQSITIVCIASLFLSANVAGQSASNNADSENQAKTKKRKKFKLPNIDLSHWSVTVPEGKDGKAISVEPPEILNYATNETLKPYMYNDSTSGALVFYAFPSDATTANTKYSRSELREQMVPGDNNTNWTFAQGGIMKGKLAVDEVSRGSDGKAHKIIIMQIHGRLTNDQRDLIGQKDNNAPPILKIYWQDGKIRVKTKVLKNLSANENEILLEDLWDDDEGYTFKEEVGYGKFSLEVKVTDGKMVVSLNKNEYAVYDNASIRRWGVFENYFKAGNYFQSRDEGAYAIVKYYNLEVTH